MRVGSQRQAPAALLPGKRPGTHRTGGWLLMTFLVTANIYNY